MLQWSVYTNGLTLRYKYRFRSRINEHIKNVSVEYEVIEYETARVRNDRNSTWNIANRLPVCVPVQACRSRYILFLRCFPR